MSVGENFSAIVLAGGRGTRMNSSLVKALHPVAGMPMIQKILQTLQRAGVKDLNLVLASEFQTLFKQALPLDGVQSFAQKQPLGTADALKAVKIESLKDFVLVLNGDQPLIDVPSLEDFMHKFLEEKTSLSVVTSYFENPAHYGRVRRVEGKIHSIVEFTEVASSVEILNIKEINTGMYFLKKEILQKYLPHIKNKNSKKEYYLTDLVLLCRQNQEKLSAISAPQHIAFGVNTQEELAVATQYVFQKKIKELMKKGVIVIHPEHTYVEEDVEVANSTVLYPGCFLRGKTEIGFFSILEPGVIVVDCKVGDNVQIKAGSYLEDSVVERGSSVGPYAHLRPGNKIGEGVKIGNFVEMKKVAFGNHSKASHLSYLGDATIGEHVNIGCGTITCNYATDKNKYETKIGDHAFVGSHSQLVAPVEVGPHSVIGSGSVITRDVPPGALSLTRIPQINKENYNTPFEDENHPSLDSDSTPSPPSPPTTSSSSDAPNTPPEEGPDGLSFKIEKNQKLRTSKS